MRSASVQAKFGGGVGLLCRADGLGLPTGGRLGDQLGAAEEETASVIGSVFLTEPGYMSQENMER